MTSFGLAMEKTGATRWLAVVIAGWTEPLGVYFVLDTFLAPTMLLIQAMSKAAAALVVLPGAVSTALTIGVEPRTFALLVSLAASLPFIAPSSPPASWSTARACTAFGTSSSPARSSASWSS